MSVNVGLYQHFKGEFYYVDGLVRDCSTDTTYVHYFNVIHPEYGNFIRPVYDWFSDVSDREDNVTGQEKRFMRVSSLDNPIKNFSTTQLIKELASRVDSPFQKLDIKGLSDKCVYTDYCLGEYYPKVGGVDTIVSFSSRKDADNYIQNHLIKKKNVNLYKRTFVEVE